MDRVVVDHVDFYALGTFCACVCVFACVCVSACGCILRMPVIVGVARSVASRRLVTTQESTMPSGAIDTHTPATDRATSRSGRDESLLQTHRLDARRLSVGRCAVRCTILKYATRHRVSGAPGSTE